jgi:hypothetical protein
VLAAMVEVTANLQELVDQVLGTYLELSRSRQAYPSPLLLAPAERMVLDASPLLVEVVVELIH